MRSVKQVHGETKYWQFILVIPQFGCYYAAVPYLQFITTKSLISKNIIFFIHFISEIFQFKYSLGTCTGIYSQVKTMDSWKSRCPFKVNYGIKVIPCKEVMILLATMQANSYEKIRPYSQFDSLGIYSCMFVLWSVED